ncbi:MAG: J domain-containing protein [Deltaproteobacteria bacterium]|nr:J domain-containing protein [Deltaproteobacteria bacterium]
MTHNNQQKPVAGEPGVPALHRNPRKGECQACGLPLQNARRKYCSRACREKLVYKLDVATNLLRAIHTRYATFSFTGRTLALNVVVWGASEVYSFFWEREAGAKPADDLARLTEELGREWWRKQNQSNSRHQAAWHVLGMAKTRLVPLGQVRPVSVYSPRVPSRYLTVLKLSSDDLFSENPGVAIKSAFRRQAHNHHPDKNGDARMFRELHQAYMELLAWARDPLVRNRQGLPQKWCYNGRRWVPPMVP